MQDRVQKRIDHSMSLECAQQVDRNRQFLKSIISCLEFREEGKELLFQVIEMTQPVMIPIKAILRH